MITCPAELPVSGKYGTHLFGIKIQLNTQFCQLEM